MINNLIANLASYCGLSSSSETTPAPSNELLTEHILSATNSAESISKFLPYFSHDPKTGVFTNDDSTAGFFYEISPLVGSNEGLEKNLTLFFNDELPENGYLQFLIVATHEIEDVMTLWRSSRTSKEESLTKITNIREKFIKNLSKDFENASSGRLTRNYRTFVSYSTKINSSSNSVEQLLNFQKKLENKLKTEKLSPSLMSALDLIKITKSIIQMDLNEQGTRQTTHNPYSPIKDQILSPMVVTQINEQSIEHIDTKLESRAFYPASIPKSFSLPEMIALLGSSDKVIPARFIISYSLASNIGPKGTSKIINQGYRSLHAAEKDYTRNDISAKEEAREWREVINIHKKGERFLSENLLVMITAPKDVIDSAEESIKSIWNALDWKLKINKHLQLLSLISILPMLQCSMWPSLIFFRLTKNALSGEVVAKLPLQGEWKGVPASGVLMIGRRGQLFNWNPYYRIGGGGNYNISMMAPSGSGKSFFLQELATSMLSQGVSIFIMDIGASYKNLCHLLSGEMVRFNTESQISLNPFSSLSGSGATYMKALELLKSGKSKEEVSNITDLTLEQLELLKNKAQKTQESIEILEIKGEHKSHFVTKDSIIYAKAMLSSMCNVSGKAREEAILEKAISIGITKHEGDLDITKLTKILENLTDTTGEKIEGAKLLADSLYPFTENGIHGRFFKHSKNQATFTSNLTLFEFEELVNDAPLLSVVLQIILMQITMQFLCGDRTKRFMLIVDEAWMIMDFAAGFLERFARTVRKYGGSLVVCTQDLSSFQKGSSQSAILESSTWKLILQQKEEGIAAFAKEEGYHPYLPLIKSLRKCSNNKFSEVLFDTNGAKVVGRLAVDPFSTAIYSTESEDYAFLVSEERKGTSKDAAIMKLASKYGALAE